MRENLHRAIEPKAELHRSTEKSTQHGTDQSSAQLELWNDAKSGALGRELRATLAEVTKRQAAQALEDQRERDRLAPILRQQRLEQERASRLKVIEDKHLRINSSRAKAEQVINQLTEQLKQRIETGKLPTIEKIFLVSNFDRDRGSIQRPSQLEMRVFSATIERFARTNKLAATLIQGSRSVEVKRFEIEPKGDDFTDRLAEAYSFTQTWYSMRLELCSDEAGSESSQGRCWRVMPELGKLKFGFRVWKSVLVHDGIFGTSQDGGQLGEPPEGEGYLIHPTQQQAYDSYR